MKKSDNAHRYSNEEKKGFRSVGYLENSDYVRRLCELSRRQLENEEIDTVIDKVIINNKIIYLDANFSETTPLKAVYSFYPTGYKAFRNGNEIIGGFHRISPDDSWRGVYLDSDSESLKKTLKSQRPQSVLSDYTYIHDYDHIVKVCSEVFAKTRGEDEWIEYVSLLFIKRKKQKEIFQFPSGSFFKADELSTDKENMYFWMEQNDRQGVRQKMWGISLVDENTLLEYWSDPIYENTLDRMVFDNWEGLEEFVEDVALTAMPENWGRLSSTPELSYGYPVLKSYLAYTFIRLRSLDQKEVDKDYIVREKHFAYFNTGLLNKFFRQIIIGGSLQIKEDDVPGLGKRIFEFLINPFVIVSGHDSKFSTPNGLYTLPKIATYFEEKEDVLFDAGLEIMLNDEHIFEDGLKANRIPIFRDEYHRVKGSSEDLKNLHVRVQARIQTAIQRARLLAERNYKLAVPQFWKEDGEVQFLLPLYMEETEYTGRPQCALALKRVGNGNYYEGATILSLDMAYNNARLISKPDVTWLNRENSIETANFERYKLTAEEINADEKLKADFVSIEDSASNGNGASNESNLPNAKNIGRFTTLTGITLRAGKGIKGKVFNATGTVAKSLLTNTMSSYVGSGALKVKIADINPQGTQYILEPEE